MKVTTYDEIDPELVGIGQTTNQSPSLRKGASIATGGHTNREEKRVSKEIRKKKNTRKGKVERTKTPKRDQKLVSKRLRERKSKEELFNAHLETFVLEESPVQKQMTESQKTQIHNDLERRGLLDTKLCPDKESVCDQDAKDIDKFAVKQWYRHEKREK